MENGKIEGIRTPKPLKRLSKIWHGWLRRRYDPARQNLNRSPPVGRLRQTGEKSLSRGFILWSQFLLASPETKPESRFFRGLIHRMSIPGYWFPRGIKLQKVSDYAYFYPQQHPKKGCEWVSSSLTLKILKLANYRNYCTDDSYPPNTLRGWSKQAYNKSKMADGRRLKKIEKRPYLRNGFTDLHEIWQGDAR